MKPEKISSSESDTNSAEPVAPPKPDQVDVGQGPEATQHEVATLKRDLASKSTTLVSLCLNMQHNIDSAKIQLTAKVAFADPMVWYGTWNVTTDSSPQRKGSLLLIWNKSTGRKFIESRIRLLHRNRLWATAY